jgi:hypothetical protein
MSRMSVGASLLVSLALAAGPAQSTAADAAIRSALSRVGHGTSSPADLALLRRHPAVAAGVPDPQQALETGRTSGRRAQAAAAATCGRWVDVWYRRRSLLGSTIYVWHHRVEYCSTPAAVTRWQTRYDYLTNVAAVIYVRERVVDTQTGLGTVNASSHLQRHLEYCIVKYGCYANSYPWARITVHPGGTYTSTGASR